MKSRGNLFLPLFFIIKSFYKVSIFSLFFAKEKLGKRCWVYWLLIMIIASCHEKPKGKSLNRQFENTKVNIKGATLFKQVVGNIKTFHIPDLDTTYLIDSLIETAEYLTLERTPLSAIGAISDVLFTKEHLIIVDKIKAKAVFIFDRKGKFINRIKSDPLSSKTYTSISNVYLSESKSEIVVHDNKISKLFHYNLNGTLVETEEVGLRYSVSIPVGDDLKLLFSNDLENEHLPEIDNYSLLVMRGNDKVMFKDFFISPIFNDFPLFASDHLTRHDSTILFFPRFSDTVFKVGGDGVKQPLYKLATNNLMPLEFLYDDKNRKMFPVRIAKTNFAFYMGGLYENSSHIIAPLLRGSKQGETKTVVIDKRRGGKCVAISEVGLVSDKKISYPTFRRPIQTNEDKFVSVIMPSVIERYTPLLLGKSNITFSKEMLTLIQNHKKENNPILFFYTLRSIK